MSRNLGRLGLLVYAAQGMVPQGSGSPEELDRFLRTDFERMAKLIKISGIKPE